MATDIIFKWNKKESVIVEEAMRIPESKLFMANEWWRLYNPFVPMQTGMLANDSVSVYVEDGIGIIHHGTPYARRQYWGVTYNFSKEKHPLASAKWDQAAKSAGKAKQLVNSLQMFIKRGPG